MPIKGGRTDLDVVDRWDGGVGWIAHPDEEMRRASHALADGGDLWLVDPVDAPGLDDLLADHGTVAGVVVCLDRHLRDAAALATRHGVAVHIPDWMTGVAPALDAPVERIEDRLGTTGYRTLALRDASVPPWQELGLHDPADGTLYVPESVGTAPFFLASEERLGVHPMLRLFPPRGVLGGLNPDRVLVGHGTGIDSDAGAALRDALDGARRNAPSAYAGMVRELF